MQFERCGCQFQCEKLKSKWQYYVCLMRNYCGEFQTINVFQSEKHSIQIIFCVAQTSSIHSRPAISTRHIVRPAPVFYYIYAIQINVLAMLQLNIRCTIIRSAAVIQRHSLSFIAHLFRRNVIQQCEAVQRHKCSKAIINCKLKLHIMYCARCLPLPLSFRWRELYKGRTNGRTNNQINISDIRKMHIAYNYPITHYPHSISYDMMAQLQGRVKTNALHLSQTPCGERFECVSSINAARVKINK